MTPEQRLAAFLAHCQLMAQLHGAGRAVQHRPHYAVIGAMAAAVHGVVRASLDADAVVTLRVQEARALRQPLAAAGYEAELRVGDVDDPIPALLEVRDRHGNRVDLLIGPRGMDPELLDRTGQVSLADARAVIDLDRESLDLELLRRQDQGHCAAPKQRRLLAALEHNVEGGDNTRRNISALHRVVVAVSEDRHLVGSRWQRPDVTSVRIRQGRHLGDRRTMSLQRSWHDHGALDGAPIVRDDPSSQPFLWLLHIVDIITVPHRCVRRALSAARNRRHHQRKSKDEAARRATRQVHATTH